MMSPVTLQCDKLVVRLLVCLTGRSKLLLQLAEQRIYPLMKRSIRMLHTATHRTGFPLLQLTTERLHILPHRHTGIIIHPLDSLQCCPMLSQTLFADSRLLAQPLTFGHRSLFVFCQLSDGLQPLLLFPAPALLFHQ